MPGRIHKCAAARRGGVVDSGDPRLRFISPFEVFSRARWRWHRLGREEGNEAPRHLGGFAATKRFDERPAIFQHGLFAQRRPSKNGVPSGARQHRIGRLLRNDCGGGQVNRLFLRPQQDGRKRDGNEREQVFRFHDLPLRPGRRHVNRRRTTTRYGAGPEARSGFSLLPMQQCGGEFPD